jgi:fatty acid desaturase
MYGAKTDGWYLERILACIAGAVTLTSLALALVHSPYWLLLAAFTGLNEIMFGVAGFCFTSSVLYALGAKPRLPQKNS